MKEKYNKDTSVSSTTIFDAKALKPPPSCAVLFIILPCKIINSE